MKLDSPKKQLEILLSAAKTTTDMDVCVSFEDTPSSSVGSLDTTTNGTTAVPICYGPDAGVVRTVSELSVLNRDTTSKEVTIRLNNNGTIRKKLSWTIQPGDMLGYTDSLGWYSVDSSGQKKFIVETGGTTIKGSMQLAANYVPPINVWTKINCDAGLLMGGNNGVTFDTVADTLTITSLGEYRVTLHADIYDTAAIGTVGYLTLYVNGARYSLYDCELISPPVITYQTTSTIIYRLNLNAGDVLELYVWANSATFTFRGVRNNILIEKV